MVIVIVVKGLGSIRGAQKPGHVFFAWVQDYKSAPIFFFSINILGLVTIVLVHFFKLLEPCIVFVSLLVVSHH